MKVAVGQKWPTGHAVGAAVGAGDTVGGLEEAGDGHVMPFAPSWQGAAQ